MKTACYVERRMGGVQVVVVCASCVGCATICAATAGEEGGTAVGGKKQQQQQ